ncbi:hypothetical protein QFC19_004585 [Naganishia cerealis]|uniref:Uncharacterized protein n=1 Tax=Naganishia cerealis TaxID=610337 RepID=A0ACC2VWQ4_9TREE|nr:hypothetical protein QFC19_004585 [Naganishia cerealis]
MPARSADDIIPDVIPPPAYQLVPPPVIPSERGGDNRPALPFRARNLFLDQGLSPTTQDPDALVVKFQTIVRDGKEIIVGRLKVPTLLAGPLEHAFILRRYDTGAISVTTMYKAAFPSATAEDEEREMKWIKSSFDMSGMNGSRVCSAVKLAGNWAPLNLAKHLAPAYKLEPWIEAMCAARPETGVAYRKSQRSQRAAEEASQRTTVHPAAAANPVHPTPANGAVNTGAINPASIATQHSPQRQQQQVTTPGRNVGLHPSVYELAGDRMLPVHPRAMANHEQPAPASAAPSAPQQRTPGRAAKRSRPTPAEGEVSPTATTVTTTSAVAPDHVTVTLQSTHELHAPLNTSVTALTAAAEAEIAASKADVLALREEALARSAAGESASEMGLVSEPISGGPGATLVRGIKRTTEDVSVEDEAISSASLSGGAHHLPANPVSALANSGTGRVIAGNRRIVAPEVAVRRQGVWGGAMFAAGMAVSYFASNFLL